MGSVYEVRTAVQPRASWNDVEQDASGICIVLCCWLQERVDSGESRTEKRKGEHNTADIGTKAVSAEVLRRHLKTLKMGWRDGRHPSALRAVL